MHANRVLLLSAAVGSLVVGWACGGKEDRSHASAARAVTPPPAAAPVRTTSAPKSSTKRAPAPTKPTKKPTTKTSNKSSGSALTLKVPEAHLPPAGQCRIWKEGATPFQQPQSRSCDGIVAMAPAGSMILERPSKDSKVIRVRYVDASKAGHVVLVRVFDAATGKYLREG
ncbi:MAG TPA: hypothetical protein VLV16_06260 [Gemmatimonadales bacterium]|nr:hypothetical protein [Gemmatimonadales bacterium]